MPLTKRLHSCKAFAIKPYPKELEQEFCLQGRRAILLRPVKPEDERLYQGFVARVSPEDMRLRFFNAVKGLSPAFLARLTQIDYARQMAFVALDRQTGELLGVSRFEADSDLAAAEFAVMVRSDMHGQGLGWVLMQHLIDHARALGVGELNGQILRENALMLKMAGELGFRIEPDNDDHGVYRATLDLKRAAAI